MIHFSHGNARHLLFAMPIWHNVNTEHFFIQHIDDVTIAFKINIR